MLIDNIIDLSYKQYLRDDGVTYETYTDKVIITTAVIKSLSITTSLVKDIEVTVTQKI